MSGEIRIALRFIGGYSGLVGKREDEISVPEGTSVRELLGRLAERYGSTFENRLGISNGALRSDCRVFLGEEDVAQLGLDARVTSSEITLFFLTSVAGGSFH
ncbi:MAG: MoaD/ThiS family protein [Dehalococcoidia bacterium]|nr:MoaD/ThiS family protein [Dehalococcoidia bacterium]